MRKEIITCDYCGAEHNLTHLPPIDVSPRDYQKRISGTHLCFSITERDVCATCYSKISKALTEAYDSINKSLRKK